MLMQIAARNRDVETGTGASSPRGTLSEEGGDVNAGIPGRAIHEQYFGN